MFDHSLQPGPVHVNVLLFALLGRVAELVGRGPAPLLALTAGGGGGRGPRSQRYADVTDLQLVTAQSVQHQALSGVARRPALPVHEVRMSQGRLKLHL